MTLPRQILLLTAATLALAGCGGPQVVVDTSRTRPVEAFYGYGAGDRDLQLVVRGNPFAMPQESFDQAVERGIASAGSELPPPTRIRLHPDSSARPGYQLVLVFTPLATTDSQDACDGAPGGIGPVGGNITVVAAFCVAGRAATGTTGWVTAASPDDPKFSTLLSSVGGELFRSDEKIQGSGASSP